MPSTLPARLSSIVLRFFYCCERENSPIFIARNASSIIELSSIIMLSEYIIHISYFQTKNTLGRKKQQWYLSYLKTIKLFSSAAYVCGINLPQASSQELYGLSEEDKLTTSFLNFRMTRAIVQQHIMLTAQSTIPHMGYMHNSSASFFLSRKMKQHNTHTNASKRMHQSFAFTLPALHPRTNFN